MPEQADISEGSCSKWKAHDGAGKKCEEEGTAQRSCYGLATIPMPHLPAPFGMGRDVLGFVFVFHHPILFLIGNKLKSVLPMMITGRQSPFLYLVP